MDRMTTMLGTWGGLLVCLATFCAPNLDAGSIMYGGLGGHNNGDSTNDGALGTVNQTTGTVTIVGHPANVARISGLAFDLVGNLFASTQPGGGFPPPPGPMGASQLLRLNPATGATIASLPIMEGLTAISIADLAFQPSTGLLYGIRGPADGLGGQGELYTINPATGAATLRGNTGDFFGSIAFAPDGTLYMSSADLDAMDNVVNIRLKKLNPSTAATLSSVPTHDLFGALAVRPDDGVIFAGNGDQGQLFTVNPVTGAETLIGSTGRNFVGDFAFQVPEPASFALVGLGLFALIGREGTRRGQHGWRARWRRPSVRKDRS